MKFDLSVQIPEFLANKYSECKLDDLTNTGEISNSTSLGEGDVISFPDLENMQFWMFSFKPGQTPSPCITASINDRAPQPFFISILRKAPAKEFRDNFFSKYPVNREIYEMDNDSERAKKLAGKKLRVTSLVEEQKEVWENTDSGRKIAKDENGMEKTQPSIFFIFEWVE